MTEYLDFSRIGGLYNEDHRRIAQVIQDIFPNVHLIRMDPSMEGFNPERPYGLFDQPARLDLPHYLIRAVAESEIDHRLVAELIRNNMHDPDSEVSKIQLLEMSYALTEAKREEEVLAEKKDMMKSAMASKKHTWTHNGQTLRK
jgi:hypothetical protein